MRLWHYALFPYLPDRQFRGQLREVIVVMRNWRDKGSPNSLILNRITEYPKEELYSYFILYSNEYHKRYNKSLDKHIKEFSDFAFSNYVTPYPFSKWHNNIYLKVCMTNLFEKYYFGVGKSKLTEDEWQLLCNGYENITGEKFIV